MDGTAVDGDRHFSGVVSRMVVTYLADEHGPAVLGQVLDRAAEVGSEDELRDDAAWLSYRRVRRLFEAVTEVLGGSEPLRRAALSGRLDEPSRADMSQMLMDFGTPDNLLRTAFRYGTAFGLSTIMELEGDERSDGEWDLTHRFKGDFEPFPEFCAYMRGLHALLPTVFGLPPAEVSEESCACHGAPDCTFRVSWHSTVELGNQKSFFETRSSLLEARLDTLQRTVIELVSAPDPIEGLRRVLEAAARAVHVPAYLLAVDPALPLSPHLHFAGLGESEAAVLSETISRHTGIGTDGIMAVEVSSTRCHYGHLAAIEPASRRFLPQELDLMTSYANLAAAALDSATAYEEARRQATTAQTLLGLSSSLTELRSTEEMALNLARAVPSVIDCDRSIVFIHDPASGELQVAATHGFPEPLERRLAAVSLPSSAVSVFEPGVSYYDQGQIAALHTYDVVLDRPSVAAASIPMVANDELMGALVVVVTTRPARLEENPSLGEALRGLAGQAAVAVRNARLVDEIRHQALHDVLTGLPNRTLVLDRLEQALARSRRDATPVAALFIDLDGFKEINDTLGHAAGDRLLVALSERLQLTLRANDTLGRLGGDEFVVVAEGGSLSAGPEVIAERILDVLRAPFHLEEYEDANLSVTSSIGIALGHRDSAGEMLRDADIALYRAKEQGKNCFVLYQPEMSQRMQNRFALEKDLRQAVVAEQFFLLYQPFFDLRRGTVIGAEALLRWQHPLRGVVDAQEFVPVLEDIGALDEVGRWVFEEATRQGRRWHDMGHRIDVSVNVSRVQLESGHLVDDAARALDGSGFDPGSLVIEITEASITRDSPVIATELLRLKELGVKVAIDDFGTAYSSLAYLSNFSVDEVKIDRSFISSIDDSAEAGSLIHVLLELGKTLGLRTLAEGIESTTQVSHLQQERCDGGQGFLLARPLAPEALEDLLVSDKQGRWRHHLLRR